MLPRSAPDLIRRLVFAPLRAMFLRGARLASRYERRDSVMALYAPVALLSLLLVWLSLSLLGFMGIYWALGVRDVGAAFKVSGSSLLTLGFAPVQTTALTVASFAEAALGLIIIALLIAYLPVMYSAFSQRELLVSLLEVRAGSPPSAVTMIKRFYRIGWLEDLGDMWHEWEEWFASLGETHTSLAALAFFRSPQAYRSWVTAAGTVLDGAALMNAVVDVPHVSQADLCIRAGYIALRNIAKHFGIAYDPEPRGDELISISRYEFDAACEDLAEQGVPLKSDREQAWHDYVGWRVNYDTVLLALAALVNAPYAPWSSDRSSMAQRDLQQ